MRDRKLYSQIKHLDYQLYLYFFLLASNLKHENLGVRKQNQTPPIGSPDNILSIPIVRSGDDDVVEEERGASTIDIDRIISESNEKAVLSSLKHYFTQLLTYKDPGYTPLKEKE